MDEVRKNVAELTFYYKNKRLASFIFDKQETADIFAESLAEVLGKDGMKNVSLSGEIKPVYTNESILEEIDDYRTGRKEIKGTIFDMIQAIDMDGLN